jgi:hypothetical protein
MQLSLIASQLPAMSPLFAGQPGLFGELSVYMNFLRHFGKGLRVVAQMTVLQLPLVEARESGEQFLKFAVTIGAMQGRDKLRLESVQAATCGAENARDSEDYFGRFFYGSAGSSFCNGSAA